MSRQAMRPKLGAGDVEAAEWRDALLSLLEADGPERVRAMLDLLQDVAERAGVGWRPVLGTPYVNSISVQ